MKKEKRFVKIYSQEGFSKSFEIIADKETGVQYLVTSSGYGHGVTPLLGNDGKPVIRTVFDED